MISGRTPPHSTYPNTSQAASSGHHSPNRSKRGIHFSFRVIASPDSPALSFPLPRSVQKHAPRKPGKMTASSGDWLAKMAELASEWERLSSPAHDRLSGE